jgi:GT2 family glycosyltransferase
VPEAEEHRPSTGDPDARRSHDPVAWTVGWMADRLADQLLRTAAPEPIEDGSGHWGRDASMFPPDYWNWIHLTERFQAEHGGERTQDLPTDGPLLSVVIPVYRPELWYFRECIQSVIDQSYQRWELCLCDDSSGDPELTRAMAEFVTIDPRIRAFTLEANGGISRATNRALAEARGEFIVLVDHDDLLEPTALAEIAAIALDVADADIIYSDEDKVGQTERRTQPHFKPDWDPDMLLAFPYLGHLMALRHDLVTGIGGFRPEFDGSQDYDLMLRATESARRVVHIPKILYHWRIVAGSAAGDVEAKPWAYAASRRALEDAVARRSIDGYVESGPFPGSYHLRRRVEGTPSVSVIIPFRDQARLTMTCLQSLETAPGYDIEEVVLVDNGSTEPETRALRAWLERRPNTRVVDYPGSFNWSAINNAAAATCRTDMLLFLNNDIEATSDGWLHALVEQAQRPEIGAVGARLIYPDGRLQHAGVILGVGGIAAHIFSGKPVDRDSYFRWDDFVRSYSAVTGACMLVRREVFVAMGGFEEALPVAFNDVDFCIRLGRAGYRILYTPHAELTHYESVSRGVSGYSADFAEFLSRWWDLLKMDDPYYNRNLGRFETWCPFRLPGADEKWSATMEALVPEHRSAP